MKIRLIKNYGSTPQHLYGLYELCIFCAKYAKPFNSNAQFTSLRVIVFTEEYICESPTRDRTGILIPRQTI